MAGASAGGRPRLQLGPLEHQGGPGGHIPTAVHTAFWTSTSGRSGADCSPPLGPCYRTPRGSLEEQPRPAAGVGRLQHTDQGSSGARLHWLSPDLPLSLGLTRLSLFLCEMTVPARRTEGVALLSKRQWVWGHRRHEGGTPKIYPYPWLL